MISYENLCLIAEKFEDDLTNFRLTGDCLHLMKFIDAVSGADKSILKDDFFNALTANEKIAFQAIREEIGLSGNISIVKMIQKTNLSRPVWTSLLQKMEKYNMATIKNQGVKGTNIVIQEDIGNEF